MIISFINDFLYEHYIDGNEITLIIAAVGTQGFTSEKIQLIHKLLNYLSIKVYNARLNIVSYRINLFR